jgi:hypothetical protein
MTLKKALPITEMRVPVLVVAKNLFLVGLPPVSDSAQANLSANLPKWRMRHPPVVRHS